MILLLGASGYIGEAFAAELRRRKTKFIPLARKQVDYTRFDLLLEFLRRQRNRCSSSTPPVTRASRTWMPASSTRQARCLAMLFCLKPSLTPARLRRFRGGIYRAAAFTAAQRLPCAEKFASEKDMTRPELHALAGKSPEKIHGFTETDTPNFSFRDLPCSFYSGTKALGEEAMAGIGQSYVWRLSAFRSTNLTMPAIT
jgi:dTDP-4-dehydrorhamnose reductase